MSSADGIAAAYWAYYLLANSDNREDRLKAEKDRSPASEVDDRIEFADADVVSLLVALADAAPSDEAVAFLGAGPLEDLIRERWADEVILDRLVGWAGRNGRFAQALRGVWFGTDVPESVATRLTMASRVRF